MSRPDCCTNPPMRASVVVVDTDGRTEGAASAVSPMRMPHSAAYVECPAKPPAVESSKPATPLVAAVDPQTFTKTRNSPVHTQETTSMYSMFIPEDRAGTIICQRVAEICREPLKRKRVAAIKECIQMLRAMRLHPKEPDRVTSLSFGCGADGSMGLIVLIGLSNTIVASTKEPR